MSLKFYYSPMSSATRIHWALEGARHTVREAQNRPRRRRAEEARVPRAQPERQGAAQSYDTAPSSSSRWRSCSTSARRYGVDKGLFFPPSTVERAEAFKWMVWSGRHAVSTRRRGSCATRRTVPRRAAQRERGRGREEGDRRAARDPRPGPRRQGVPRRGQVLVRGSGHRRVHALLRGASGSISARTRTSTPGSRAAWRGRRWAA